MAGKFGGYSFNPKRNQYDNSQRENFDTRSAAPRGSDYDKKRRKHSGCTTGVDKNKKEYVRGWNYSARRGMITAYVCEYKSTKETTSEKSGITYTNLMAKVVYKDSGVEKIYGALLSHKTKRIIIPELGMVLNPAAPNGGYFGKFSRKK
jgi:hypothetical protein